MEISNCPMVRVDNCTFTNSTSLGIGKERYSGNSGGISIGYDDQPRPQYMQTVKPMIAITQSNFTQNTATAAGDFIYTVSEVIGQRLYNQRGGAIAMYMGALNYSAIVTVSNCTFEGNVARDSGGAVYMFLSGEDSAHQVTFAETRFIRNKARDGGGLETTFITADSINNPNEVTIEDCVFTGNIGNLGGGYKSIQLDSRGNLNRVNISNTIFTANIAPTGSALYLQSLFTVGPVPLEKRVFVEDW